MLRQKERKKEREQRERGKKVRDERNEKDKRGEREERRKRQKRRKKQMGRKSGSQNVITIIIERINGLSDNSKTGLIAHHNVKSSCRS